MKLYYDHPIASYGSQKAAQGRAIIDAAKPYDKVLDPEDYIKEMEGIAKANRASRRSPYNLESPTSVLRNLREQADAIAFLPAPDGGIFYETYMAVKELRTRNPKAKIFEIDLTHQKGEAGLIEHETLPRGRVRLAYSIPHPGGYGANWQTQERMRGIIDPPTGRGGRV